MPADQLALAISEADVVICHAGTGAALTALEHGHRPVLVPRRAVHHERVDDHQLQIAHELNRRGLAVALRGRGPDRGHAPRGDVRLGDPLGPPGIVSTCAGLDVVSRELRLLASQCVEVDMAPTLMFWRAAW
ncbi:MAG: hypothetical protein H7269_05680 [Cellulomonas sp.]|nr:hypothetical protein [Cellulomonas sp.]